MARRGCQRDIAQKIIDKQADDVLALKGNQGSLREDVEIFVAEQQAVGFKHSTRCGFLAQSGPPLRCWNH
jgi:predicted transposase YbfD/YdcC